MIDKERIKDLISFLGKEVQCYKNLPEEFQDPQDLIDFEDTIEVLQSVLNEM